MPFRKNVFIVGAGFSAEAGAPLMDQFLTQARELKDNPVSVLDDHDRKIFERVLRYRVELNKALAKIHVDLDNIEQLFGFLEMDLQLSPDADSQLRNDMTYLIVRTLEGSIQKSLAQANNRILTQPRDGARWNYTFQGNQYGFFAGFVSGLWNPDKQVEQKSLDTIITFNYDLLLDREMFQLDIVPNYYCEPASFKYSFPAPGLHLNLLKMHGSANWTICSECRDKLYIWAPQEAEVFRLTNQECPTCRRVSLTPFIVPPTWNKGIEEKFLRPVWSRALQELITAGRIFIVGYSFPETDQFFKYLLGLALAANNDLSEVWVLNPGSGIAQRFEQLFVPYFHQRTVRHQGWRTAEFIRRLQELTRQEFVDGDLGERFRRDG